MRQGFLRSSRYSPGNMNRESLEALFVGRQGVMEDVLSRLTKSIQNRRNTTFFWSVQEAQERPTASPSHTIA